jgi:predicted MPP superfamily phosphohydrolase
LLLNESHVEGTGSASLAVAGFDDPLRGEPDPGTALLEVPADAVQVWAFHAPGYADRLRGAPISRPAFMLAGHTHGGQVRPPLLPAITPPGSGRFLAGWYRDTFAPLYVNRGVGTTTIRARFRCPPEIALITLVRGPAADQGGLPASPPAA